MTGKSAMRGWTSLMLGLAVAGPALAEAQPQLGARTAPRLSVDGLAFKDLNRNGKLDPYEDWRLSAQARAADLTGRMTLEEKAGTMMHGTLPAPGNAFGSGERYDLAGAGSLIADKQVSSFITRLAGSGAVIAEENNKVQALAEQSANLQTMLHQSQSVLSELAARREGLVTSVGSITRNVTRLSEIVDAITPDLQQFVRREPGFLQHGLTDGRARFAFMAANLPLVLKGLARTTQDGTYINLYACDLDLALWRGLFHWFRAFVIAATPGNGNEVWHTAKCR